MPQEPYALVEGAFLHSNHRLLLLKLADFLKTDVIAPAANNGLCNSIALRTTEHDEVIAVMQACQFGCYNLHAECGNFLPGDHDMELARRSAKGALDAAISLGVEFQSIAPPEPAPAGWPAP